MHKVSTCEFCGEILDGEVFFDLEQTNELQALGAPVSVSYTLCNACLMVNEIVNYDYSKELTYV